MMHEVVILAAHSIKDLEPLQTHDEVPDGADEECRNEPAHAANFEKVAVLQIALAHVVLDIDRLQIGTAVNGRE